MLFNYLKRTFLFAIVMLLANSLLMSQTTIQIGTGTITTSSYPLYGYYGNSWSQQIYTSSEINTSGNIIKIAYQVNSTTTTNFTNQKIYLKESNVSTFSSGYYVSPISEGATLVYDGNVTYSNGWVEITLQTPFAYNGANNLIVYYENRNGTNYGSYPSFYTTSTGQNMNRYYYNSSVSYVFNSSYGYTNTYRNNIKLAFQTAPNDLAVVDWVYPLSGSSASQNTPIILKVKNVGTTTQSNFTVKYSINNGATWTSTTYPSAVGSNVAVNVSFGSLMADMSAPGVYRCIGVVRNTGDTVTTNDTLRRDITICGGTYSGTYTIGNDTSYDFPSVQSAISSLGTCGISGPVTFKLQSGIYNEQLHLSSIYGASSTTPITFTSLTGNPDDVVFRYGASSVSDNYVLRLDTASYINIKNITFKALGSTYSTVASVVSSSNCTLEGNKFISTTTTSNSSYQTGVDIVSNTAAVCSNISIKNNEIKYGSYGIYDYTSSSYNQAQNIEIENNDISNFANSGIYMYYTTGGKINSNKIYSPALDNAKGIYLGNCTNISEIAKNKVNLVSGICLYSYYLSGNATQPTKIANNFFTQSAQTNNTANIYNSNYINFDFNSIKSLGNSSNYNNVYIYYGSYINFRNNNIVNSAGGKAIYNSTTSNVIIIDYNNYFTSGSNIAAWSGISKTTLSALQSASGKDAHSLNNNITFYSDENLHISGSSLNNMGTPISGITDDIDGQTRNTTTPDIGADEFSIYPNDGGLISLQGSGNACPGSAQNIVVSLKNFGSSALTNVTFGMEINGSNASTLNWTGLLGALNTTNATVASYNFSADTTYNLKIYIKTVNNGIDSNAYNDTIEINSYHTSYASGTYIIGGSSSANFTDISSAINALEQYGICGPIVFKIESGTYTGNYIISNNLGGLSSTNTITFESQTGDTADVTLEYSASGSSDAYIFNITSASYINFKNISFKTNSIYSRAIKIDNSSHHILIEGCLLKGNQYTVGGYDYYSNISINNSHHITIQNSTLLNASIGIYSYGANGSDNSDIKIKNNTIKDFYISGFYSYYTGDSLIISGNTFDVRATSNNSVGISLSQGNGLVEINNNIIEMNASSVSYAIYLYYQNYYYTSTNGTRIYNNSINIENTNSAFNAIYSYRSYYTDIYFNTIRSNTIYSSAKAIYAYYNYYINIKNNNFDVGAASIYYLHYGNITSSDYNNFNSTNTNPMYVSGYTRTIANHISSSGYDSHSKNVAPNYISANDFHLYDQTLNNAGTPISGITTDIDGDTRNSSSPDIGADEFDMLSLDVQLYAINKPNNISPVGSNQIKVAIRNTGTSYIVIDSLHYQIDNGNTNSTLWTGYLAPLEIDSFILIGTETLTAGSHNIKTWSSRPNNGNDLNHNNDTLSKTFTVQVMPSISVEPLVLSGTISSCDDSITVPLVIKNIGGATLNLVESNSGAIPYDSTLSQNFYSTGQTITHTFTNVPTSSDTVLLTITINGDYDSYTEYVSIYVDNTYVNQFQGGSTNTTLSTTYILTGSNLATWLSDGILIVKMVNSSAVNTGYGTNLNQARIQTSGDSWLHSNSTSNYSIASGDSTIINYVMSGVGLDNGVYSGEIHITSNDLGNPNIIVPCSMTVAGPPSISTSYNSISFSSAYVNVAIYDTLEVLNTGCGNLIMSNITTTNTAFSSTYHTDTIVPGDTGIVVYKFLTSTQGAYAANSTIYSNTSNYTISLAANATNPPAITATPNPMNVTITNCDDSISTNLQIQNTGGGTLTATVEKTKDTVEVIVLTYGSYSSYLNNTISSLGETFTKYNYTTSYTTNGATLQNEINSVNADVIVIPYINGSTQASSYSGLATTLQSFTNNGGMVIFAGQYYDNIFSATGLISGTRIGGTDYSTLYTQNTADPITLNFASSYSSSTDDFNYYTFTGSGVTSLVKYGTYDMAVKKTYGAGLVVVIGHYYNSITQVNTRAILSNSIKLASEQGADWLQFTTSTANLSTGTSALKAIQFNANGLATGTYTSAIKITSNSPSAPIIYVPCTLVVQNQMPNGVNLGADTTNCGAITLNAGSYSSYLWNTGNTTQTISAVSTGTYSVTVSNGGNCTSSDVIAVTINPIPSVSLTGLPASSCTNGNAITLNASPYGGVFAGPGVSSNSFNPTTAGVGTHTIFYSYTNAYNCTNSASQNITVYAPPTVSFTGLNSTYCPQGTASVLTGNPTGGTFSGNGMVQNTFVPNLAGIGTHPITYSYTDNHNCSNSSTNTTTINASSITINITGYQSDYCIDGQLVTFSATPAGGTFYGPGMNANVFDPGVAGLGTHYIKYSKLDPNSCLIVDSVAITVHALPTGLSISGLSQAFCANDAAIAVGGYPAGGVFSGSGISGNTFNPSVAGPGNHNITYTYTNNFGCSSSTIQPAVVNSIPVITFTNLQNQYCVNDAATSITVTPTGGTLSGNELTGNSFNPSYAGTGSYWVYYEYTNANSCYNKDSFNIIVNSVPNVSLGSLPNSLCSNGNPITLTGTPIGGSFTGNGVTGNQFNPIMSSIGNNYIKYQYTDNNGCSDSDSSILNIIAVHNVIVGNDTTINYNTNVQLNSLISGGSGSFSFAWSPANMVTNASQLSPYTVNLTNSTLFTLTVADNSTNCSNSDQILVTVGGGVLTGNVSASPSTICAGENTQLQALGSGGASNYTYQWSSNPSGFASTIANPIFNPNVTTTFTCIIGDNIDTVHKSIVITVNPSPAVSLQNLNSQYCNNENVVNLQVSPPGGNLSGNGISGMTFNPASASLGANTIIYSYTNSFNCYNADTQVVNIFNSPSAYAGRDTLLPCLNGGIPLGQQPVNGVSYLWTPAIGLSNNQIANPTATPNLSINYALQATNTANNCMAFDTVHILVTGAPTAHASNDTIVCANSPVTLTASGGVTYFWSNGAIGDTITVSPSTTTLYYVIVSQDGCSDLDTVFVNISKPMPNLGPDTTICGNASITLDAGAGYTSYVWSTNATSQTISVDSNGIGYNTSTYIVEVYDNLNCNNSDTINVTFENCNSINNINDDLFVLSIYPNPSKGQFTVESNITQIRQLDMSIMNSTGKLIKRKSITNNTGTFRENIDLSAYSKGIYLIKLSNESNEKSIKIIIQ